MKQPRIKDRKTIVVPDRQKKPKESENGYPDAPPQRPKKDEPYSPFLVMRYQFGDGGIRPIPSGEVFWESPDVWVVSSVGINMPKAGEANRIFARVSNLGSADALVVNVRFWWANPSIAITPATAHLIGSATIDVPSGYSREVECPVKWLPVVENGGHECIMAEAWAPYLDEIQSPLDPVNDRHVCQKNLQIIKSGAGMKFSFRVHAANLTPKARNLAIQVHPVAQAGMRHDLLRQQLSAGKTPKASGHLLTPRITIPKEGALVPPSRRIPLSSAVVENAVISENALFSTKKMFQAWETRPVEMSGTIPRTAKPGDVFAYRIVQMLDENVSGGYTLYVVVTD